MKISRSICYSSFLFRLSSHGLRKYSTKNDNHVLVYRSLSKDPFANLAFEDWIYENLNFDVNKTVLFLWRNVPTVVIGRHQNPWKECNLQLMKSLGINLARRNSGGGTVYHDLGNVNCTFFTNRNAYNRKNNLGLLARFLKEFYKFDVSVNERDDLMLDSSFKISGTAAKLGLRKAYHHCTILCKVDTARLNAVLLPSYSGIFSNATRSVRSDTKNLFDDSCYDWQEFTNCLAKFFVLESTEFNDNLGWDEHVIDVDPLAQEKSPEISKRKHELSNWEWIYGKTPKFTCTMAQEFAFGRATLTLTINKGIIIECTIECSKNDEKRMILQLAKELIGTRFSRPDVLMTLCQCLSSKTLTVNYHQEQILKELSEFIVSSLH